MWINNVVEDVLESICYGSGNDLVRHIAHTDRSIVFHRIWILGFWNESDDSGIPVAKSFTMVKNSQGGYCQILPYRVPIILKEDSSQTIRSWGFARIFRSKRAFLTSSFVKGIASLSFITSVTEVVIC